MSAPIVIFDPSLELPKITHNLYSYPGVNENSDTNQINQTKVDGIVIPLICINDMSLSYTQISFFELSSIGFMPALRITINDAMGIMKVFNKTEADNTLQIQIIPPFDNAYKKINMVFYIVNHETHGNRATFDCIYKLTGLRDSRLESFGEITTYEMMEHIAKALQLGFVSNAQSTNDKRWIYCDNISYKDLIDREMKCSGTNTAIFDSWIDFRNNITLLDIYERYNTVDNDLMVWTTPTKIKDISDDLGNISQPIQVPAVISNHYTLRNTPLFCGRYDNIMDSGKLVTEGTDEVNICYSFNDGVEDNWYFADGGIENDTTLKYKYAGEFFGTFNYLSQSNAVRLFKSKINKSCISVTLNTICLGLMRGDKVNIRWYEGNTMVNNGTMERNKEYDSNINPGDDDENSSFETQVINNEVSGQYLIKDIVISYRNSLWKQKLTLIKVKGDIKI